MKKQFQKLTGSVFKMLILFALILPGSMKAQSYCKTKGVNSITRKLWIERFDLGTISNVSGNNGGYGDFTTQTATAVAGGTIAYNITTDRLLLKSLFFTRIFIDLNNDQDFNDLGETVVEDTSNVSLAGTISIPATATVGNVRVRVAVKRIGYAPNCGSYFLGETEDYTLNITSGLCAANAGTITANFNSVCAKAGSAVLAATPNGNAVVPSGFQTIYVLTKTSGLIIEQTNTTPLFAVTGGGLYTIHTLVYDTNTLNLGIVVPGVTTGFDVNALLIQGGGSICASLDVAGAQFNVNNPDAGTLTAVNPTICGAGGTLSATANGNINVPAGYNVIYVLTSGTGLVIEQVNNSPSFTVTGSGLYTIHTLVYDSTLNLGIVVPGVTTGFDVNALLVQGGGSICASLDVAGAQFNVNNPNAGTLTAVNPTICGAGGTLSATADGNSNVPAGYSVIYVLTSGTGLVIEQVNATPTFTVTGSGLYTIHTLVYDSTLNLGIVVPGVTTGFDVNSLLVQGGGSICASLDVAGAQFNVNNPNAGTLTAVNPTICGAGGTLSATADGNSNVPAGYNVIYVLTSGTGLVIEQVNDSPSFTVTGSGLYTIHTLVYDSTLNLGIVVPGVTTGFDVNALLVQGGGSICASLDVAGAQFNVNNPDAGTLTAVNPTICGAGGTLSATADGNSNVPAGYSVIYVLTSGNGLVIEQVNATPTFNVTGSGLYTIHTLVYDSTLDLSIVVPGVTTGFDVNGLLVQGGGSICASLDVAGAQFNVNNPNAGTLTAVNPTICGAGGTLSATADGNSNVPAGYNVIYVLTSGTGLVIEQVNDSPSFTVTGSGLYTIHTLVYDSTLNLGIVVPGVTTGFDVNSLLVQGGGSICASLDVAGAQFNVNNPDAGNINPDQFLNCLDNGSAVLTGNPVGNSNIPAGYQVVYVLTRGQGLVIQQAGANPQFTVTQTGLYRIHTLVYDPATLNLAIVVPGVTTGFDVNNLLVQGGGSICASLDVQGAPFLVFGSFICNLFGINNSIIDLPANESQMTEESIRLAENSMEGGILISNAYPNPAQSEVNIQYLTSENGITSISIQNMMGQTMMVERFEDITGLSLRTINLSALESGNYLIRLENNGKVQTTKVNVIR